MLRASDERSKNMLIVIMLLITFGTIFIYSSSFPVGNTLKFGFDSLFFVKRHLVRVVAGLVAMIFFSQFDYKILSKMSPIFYGVGIILLIMALFAPEINGAQRWVTIAGQRIQVSEIARLALVITVASRISKLEDDGLWKWENIWPLLLQIGAVVGLIVIEPDYSTSMLLVIIMGAMFLVGGFPYRYFIPTVLFGGIAAFLYGASEPYRRNRILGFLFPERYGNTLSYQTDHGLMAIGNGQVFGTGLGASEQKYGFLPEAHTDFAYSILGEEIGFIGMTILTLMYLYLTYLGFQIAKNCEDRFGKLLAFGITMVIASYFLLHSFVNLRLFPTTGVPLPFLSYGGMSLIFTSASLGIIMNISRQSSKTKVER